MERFWVPMADLLDAVLDGPGAAGAAGPGGAGLRGAQAARDPGRAVTPHGSSLAPAVRGDTQSCAPGH